MLSAIALIDHPSVYRCRQYARTFARSAGGKWRPNASTGLDFVGIPITLTYELWLLNPAGGTSALAGSIRAG